MMQSVILSLVMLVLLGQSWADDVNIVGVVDQDGPPYEENLETSMKYLQDPGSGLLQTSNVIYKSVLTRDNDSFAAMDKVCQHVTSGIDVIVDMSSRYVTSTIRSLAEALGIPHVASVDSSLYEWNQKQEYKTSVNIEPPSSVMLLAIRDIVSQENLTNVGIIYDETFDLDNKPKRLLRNIPAQHLYLRMGDSVDMIKEQLDKIKSAELHYLFLACSAANADLFLGTANGMGMMSFKYSWYVITQDSTIECSQCQTSSSIVLMTGKSTPNSKSKYVNFMQKTGRSNNFNSANIEMAAAFHFDLTNMIGLSLDQLIKGNQWKRISYADCYEFSTTDPEALAQAETFKQTLKQIQYSGVFGDIMWERDSGYQNIILDITRITFQGGVNIGEKQIGSWSKTNHLNAFDGSITNKNVKKTYRIISTEEPPFLFKTKVFPDDLSERNYYYNETTEYYYFGYCVDLIFHINKSQSMQFEFTLLDQEDGAYGTMQVNNTWNGMINELIHDRVDIIVAPLSVMAERENVIDFTVPFYDLVGITILMRKPSFEYEVFKFMNVLEDAVWGCVFSAFIIVSVLLAVFDKFSPYSYQNNRHSWDGQGEEPRVFTLKEGLWFCMTSLTPQGGGEAPRALSGRLVAATWWMFGFIMIATYTANLAAFLTVSRLDQPIESLDDLAKQFKTKYAPQESTSSETYFRRMADIEDRFYSIWKAMSLNDSLDEIERAKLAVWDYPVSDKFTNMWASMEESVFPKTFTEAIMRIKNPISDKEDFAFIGDATQNKYATLTDCNLWEVGEEFSRKPYALAVQEGSPLKNELSSVILQLLNQRVLEDLKTFWWDYNRTECQKIESESDGISIYNIGGVFLVIFIGIALGLITLAFEYYWYRVRPGSKTDSKGQPSQINGGDDVKQNGGPEQTGQDNAAYTPT